jgi:hypothetical protein
MVVVMVAGMSYKSKMKIRRFGYLVHLDGDCIPAVRILGLPFLTFVRTRTRGRWWRQWKREDVEWARFYPRL